MRLLITGAWRATDDMLNELRTAGHTLYFHKQEKERVRTPEIYEGVICNALFMHNDIRLFKQLRYIQLTSAGLDRVDVEYINAHNIELLNARGVYSAPMAEWAILRILEIYKKSAAFRHAQEEHIWEKRRDVLELCGKRALIVGCGSVGQAVAKRLKAFDVFVMGADIAAVPRENIDELYTMDRLPAAFSRADMIILTCPLTDKTRGLVSGELLSASKERCVLVNIARGAIVDEAAVCEWADGERYAALDVFESEPPAQGSPLWTNKNIIITPHNSFVGDGNGERLWRVIKKGLVERV